MILYHVSCECIVRLTDRPMWFTRSLEEARAWIKDDNDRIYMSATQSAHPRLCGSLHASLFASQVWPTADLIYSMYDAHVGEFDAADVQRFIELQLSHGYIGAVVDDYDPQAYESRSMTTSVVIFDPKLFMSYFVPAVGV